MWKLLPVLLLVACATNDPQQARIFRQVELPVSSVGPALDNQPARKTFQGKGIEGWLDQTGAWQLKGEVHHTRLRCGSYELGIQLGRGSPACSEVDWLTGVEFVTRLRHCNSASRLHVGGGQFASLVGRFAEVGCARVLVRCEGTC